MAEEPENLLLEYMRRFDARQARFEDALRDMSAHLSSIEGYLATMHGDLARHRGQIATIKSRGRSKTSRGSGSLGSVRVGSH